jgi:DNA-binding MarR family transcriptional regulator
LFYENAVTANPQPLLGALLRVPLEVIHGRILARLRAHGFDDLVLAHLAVLRYPGPDGKRPSDLAAEANMSKQAMNYLLGQLETLGYLERRADPDDLRSKRVYMTKRGNSTRAVIRDAVREVEHEWAATVGRDDIEALRTLLQRLSGTITDDGAGA